MANFTTQELAALFVIATGLWGVAFWLAKLSHQTSANTTNNNEIKTRLELLNRKMMKVEMAISRAEGKFDLLNGKIDLLIEREKNKAG